MDAFVRFAPEFAGGGGGMFVVRHRIQATRGIIVFLPPGIVTQTRTHSFRSCFSGYTGKTTAILSCHLLGHTHGAHDASGL
jgi:hypothetical protein